MKVVFDTAWCGKDAEGLQQYVAGDLASSAYDYGELERLKSEVERLQEVVTQLVVYITERSKDPHKALTMLLDESGDRYSVEEDDL